MSTLISHKSSLPPTENVWTCGLYIPVVGWINSHNTTEAFQVKRDVTRDGCTAFWSTKAAAGGEIVMYIQLCFSGCFGLRVNF